MLLNIVLLSHTFNVEARDSASKNEYLPALPNSNPVHILASQIFYNIHKLQIGMLSFTVWLWGGDWQGLSLPNGNILRTYDFTGHTLTTDMYLFELFLSLYKYSLNKKLKNPSIELETSFVCTIHSNWLKPRATRPNMLRQHVGTVWHGCCPSRQHVGEAAANIIEHVQRCWEPSPTFHKNNIFFRCWRCVKYNMSNRPNMTNNFFLIILHIMHAAEKIKNNALYFKGPSPLRNSKYF